MAISRQQGLINPSVGQAALPMMSAARTRLEIALRQTVPSEAVHELARALRDEGMSQPDMYRLFDELRHIHQNDEVETLYDAIDDTMDFISGWCAPRLRLFETEYPPARLI